MPDRAEDVLDVMAREVVAHLERTPRQLPTHLLYDDLGSALFDAICRLPWYAITRIEGGLLESHAAEILARVGTLSTVVELGPGNGDKLVSLLRARSGSPLAVHLIDVSSEALAQATRRVASLAGVTVHAHLATYDAGVREVRPGADGPALVVFLGSNIGNFEPGAAVRLMTDMRRAVRSGDFLLLGVDLVKPEPVLQLAYDDPLGVTAAFNRNLLLRLNRELGADFVLDAFTHRAVWNAEASRVEMHLVSRREQRVRIERANLQIQLEAGEMIWTESSYKYEVADLERMFAAAGFVVDTQWVRDGFALTLGRAV